MESNSGFELKRAVALWRLEISGNPTLGFDETLTMERHLLDCAAELQARGLTPKEAFLLARHRVEGRALDDDQNVPVDASKVWRPRLLWMLAGVLGLQVLNTVLGSALRLTTVSFGGRMDWWRFLAAVLVISIVVPIGVTVGSFCLYRRVSIAAACERWMGLLCFRRKAGSWCLALAVSLFSLAFLNDWCDARRSGGLGSEISPGAKKLSFDLRPMFYVFQFEWPVLAAGLLIYMVGSAKRSAAQPVALESREGFRSFSPAGGTEDSTAIALEIAGWRRRLAGHPGVTADQVREMAGHLHESTARFLQSGLSAHESLWLAKRRLGRVSELAAQLRGETPGVLWRVGLRWGWSGLALSWMLWPGSAAVVSTLFRLGGIGWSPLVPFAALALRAAVFWAVICALLFTRLKSFRPAAKLAQAFRFVAWGMALAAVLAVLSTSAADALWSSIHALPHFSYLLNFIPYQNIQSLLPASGSGVVVWLDWFFFGSTMQTVLLISSLYFLLRPGTESNDLGPVLDDL